MKTTITIRITRRMKLRVAAQVWWEASAEYGPLVLLVTPSLIRWALR